MFCMSNRHLKISISKIRSKSSPLVCPCPCPYPLSSLSCLSILPVAQAKHLGIILVFIVPVTPYLIVLILSSNVFWTWLFPTTPIITCLVYFSGLLRGVAASILVSLVPFSTEEPEKLKHELKPIVRAYQSFVVLVPSISLKVESKSLEWSTWSYPVWTHSLLLSWWPHVLHFTPPSLWSRHWHPYCSLYLLLPQGLCADSSHCLEHISLRYSQSWLSYLFQVFAEI